MELFFIFLFALLGFYLLGVPIWLAHLHGKIKELERAVEGDVPQRKAAPPKSAAPVKNTPTTVKQAVAAPKATVKPVAPKQSFEERVGGNLFQWLGIGALIIALSVFLKWSFENGLIGETGRIVLGYMVAAGGLLAGDMLRKKYGTWSLAFTGGGALAAYIVTWLALNHYHMFGAGVGFGMYIAVAALVCLLSMRYDAMALAGFGIVGGFATPILTGSDGSMLGLLLYIVILDIAILALGHLRSWRALNTLAFFGTLAYEIVAIDSNDLSLSTGLIFATVFTTMYTLIPAVYNVMQKQKSDAADIAILLGNGIGHFCLVLWWLDQSSSELREFYDVFVALVFALLFLLWSVALYKRNKADTPLVLSGLSLTVLFSSMAIPMQFGADWTSVAWSIEAAFLLWLSLTLRDTRIQNFAWPVMIAAYIWYFINPQNGGRSVMYMDTGIWILVFWALLFVGIAFAALGLPKNERSSSQLLQFSLIGALILAVALVIGASAYSVSPLERCIHAGALIGGSYLVLFKAKNTWSNLSEEEQRAFVSLGVATQIVSVIYLSYEFYDAVRDKRLFASALHSRQIMQVGISILWAVYGSVSLVVGIVRGWKPIRLFSLILLLVAIAKLTLIDFASLGTAARVTGFTVLGLLLVISSFIYQHNKDRMASFFTNSDSSS